MRITDSRYDRDRLRLSLAYRLIALEARTRTIRLATQLSDDRIRRMYRDYFGTHAAAKACASVGLSTNRKPRCSAPWSGAAT